MNMYAKAQAFNQCYGPGDLLLIADSLGEEFIDGLARRAIEAGSEALNDVRDDIPDDTQVSAWHAYPVERVLWVPCVAERQAKLDDSL